MSWYTSNRRAELPRNWPNIRRRILRRDRFCVLCREWESSEVDHIGDPSDHSDENLRGLCPPCHLQKSSREGAAASNRERARIRAMKKRPPEPHPGGWTI